MAGTDDAGSSPDLESVLDDQRYLVLRFGRPIATWVGLPVLALMCALAWVNDGPLAITVFELAVTVVMVGSLWSLSRDNMRKVGVIFTVSFGLICAAGLLAYGPLLGTGMMVLAWLIAASFFHGRVVAPVIGCTLGVFAVGLVVNLELYAPSWQNLEGGLVAWTRMSVTTAVMSTAVAYLVNLVFKGLGRALRQEAEAREQQARLQREREESLQALARSQRLESVGRLAGGVAHDVNNALTVLMGGIELLEEDIDVPTREVLLRDMDKAAQGALATTRQLLTFSRQSPAPGTHADPVSSLGALGRSLQRLLPAHVVVEVEVPETCRMIPMSSGALEQVLLNLCINARDAMPDGGTLTLRCRDEGHDRVVVEVEDDGEGMDEAVASRVFEPFFTTKAAHRGTGLGLSMVKDMVERSSGTVGVESKPGQGTRIWLDFPASGDATRVVEVAERAVGKPSDRRRVLLLDDEPAVCHTLERLLRRAGFEVAAVSSVEAAMREVADGSYDLFISDAILPDGDASEPIREFRKRGLRPVIIHSGYLGDDELLRKFDFEGCEFLQKPVPGALLIDTVERALGQGCGERAQSVAR